MSQRTISNAQRQRLEYQRKRIAQVDQQNADLETERSNLQNILRDALLRDSYIDLDSLKRAPRIIPFKQKRPQRESFLPPAPTGLGKMLRWKKGKYEWMFQQGEKRFKRADSEYQRAKADHEIRMNRLRDEAFEHNQKIKDLKEKFAAGQSDAVEGYFNRVLNASAYPRNFPQKSSLTYRSGSRQLEIEYDLPTLKAVPAVKAFRYVKARDEVTGNALAQSQRKQLYASVIAQIPLRTIYEIYTADRSEQVDTVIFNGYVNTIDPRTGNPGKFCLVAVSTTRHQFLDLNLELVDPQECIKGLQGRFSRKPEDLSAVEPLAPIGDDVTPVSLPRSLAAVEEPRQAHDIYRQVASPAPEEPARELPIPVRAGASSSSGSISPKGAHFVELAKKHLDRTEAQAEPVPFQQYWPTYESMNDAQQRWYFYWRAQLRQGNRLPTDLSYLFVHIYEVINVIGFDSPEESFNYLDEFWRYYRLLQPKLDRYLPDWIADFIVLHGLAPNALAWYSEVAKVTEVKDPDFAIEAWVASGDMFEALPYGVIFDLANYDPGKSKFHKQFAESGDLYPAYKRALHAIDQATRQEDGKSLFELHKPERSRVVRRSPFESAVHAYPRTEIEVAATHDWTNSKALTEILNSIVKHADNVLREQAGYKYRVRGIQLSPERKSIIASALQPEAPKREISIDPTEIEQLAKDSEAIRARLLAAEEAESEANTARESLIDEQLAAAATWIPTAPVPEPASASPEAVSDPPEAIAATLWSRVGGRRRARALMRLRRFAVAGIARSAYQAGLPEQPPAPRRAGAQVPMSGAASASDNGAAATDAPAASGFLLRPEDTPADLLTDLAEVAHIMGEGEGKRAQLMAVMMESKWECPADQIESEFPGEFINVIIDEINGIALEEIGDNLIFEEDGNWIVLDEYRDETEYILQHPDYLET